MIIKCKMCGGDLNIQDDSPICECEFCGTQQTIPMVDNEKKVNLFNRANRLRMNSEFDKAATVYASITAEFPEEAEAYWGLCLCKYGIEYVDDPASGKKIPTCHRTIPESIMGDSDFDQACEYADPVAKRLYREEAKEIDRLQQSILSIVANEQPYDVFICYKETDENGERTEDSVLAQDIYGALTSKGLKVFFSRITLEDKLGQEYEPYIYAALSSAKIMLAIGTKFEYYDAVWVKNEWMRFLSMMKTEKGKTLIPCYKGIDAYDMPQEFKNLQGQDMGKLGWLQDLLRGIEKILGIQNNAKKDYVGQESKQEEILAKRARLLAESGEWDKAIEYCEKALDINPNCSQAYLARELAERECKTIPDLAIYFYLHKTTESNSLMNARRFADSITQAALDELDSKIPTAGDDLKKKNENRLAKEKSLPNWKEKKDKLEYIRTRAELLSKRICAGANPTVVLNTDGKLLCTKVTDDQYGAYDHGVSSCTAWPAKLYSFFMETGRVYGCEIDGKIRRTDNNGSNKYIDSFVANWEVISNWEDVVQLVDWVGLIYGICGDGTVKVTGKLKNIIEYEGQDKVEHLSDISSLIGGAQGRVLFLSKDGTIKSSEYTGDKPSDVWNEMSEWKDIKKVLGLTGRYSGVRSDGTNIITSCFLDGEDTYGGIEAEAWTGIVQYITVEGRTIGLTETGNILVTDYYGKEEEDPKRREVYLSLLKWDDIAYIYFGVGRIIGITIDGRVRHTPFFGNKEYEHIGEEYKKIENWWQIVALRIGWNAIIGVRKDGSLTSLGPDYHGNTMVTNMQMFRNYDKIPEEIEEGIASAKLEREKEIERQKEEQRRQEEIRKQEIEKQIEMERQRKESLQNEKNNLLDELSNLKGLFSGKRKREIQERLDMIEQELNR